MHTKKKKKVASLFYFQDDGMTFTAQTHTHTGSGTQQQKNTREK